MKLFGREPSLWISTIGSLLSLVAGFGLDWLTPGQAALVIVALNALVGVANGLRVRPVSPVVFTYAVGSIAALVAAYGVDVSQSIVGLVNGAVLSILALLLRGNVSPVESLPEAVQVHPGKSPY
ncbi:hypothetical protein Drose_04075 [Dactylosporangium roseum]|uniref:Holin n=1 Tax=Dactylosporangium roseum TaxID=47989 RepID=A0ABY5Z619_9ACTN|nr:hypothetical protein [Dactylosporangium roseum]UWZ37466.1 hypothetical protein Drose_04075 [Dactylosporangium roseum]